jgi:hypothetical protein
MKVCAWWRTGAVTTIADGSRLSASMTLVAVNATVFKTLPTIWRRNSPGRTSRHRPPLPIPPPTATPAFFFAPIADEICALGFCAPDATVGGDRSFAH